MMSLAMLMVSCGVRDSRPLYLSSTNWPLNSICGARPGEKIRSLTWPWDLTMALMSWAVWMTRGACGAAAGTAGEEEAGGANSVGVDVAMRKHLLVRPGACEG